MGQGTSLTSSRPSESGWHSGQVEPSQRQKRQLAATPGYFPRLHLQFILYVVREFEELLLPFCLALRIAGQQPLGSRAASGLPHPLCLSPRRVHGQKAEELSAGLKWLPRLREMLTTRHTLNLVTGINPQSYLWTYNKVGITDSNSELEPCLCHFLAVWLRMSWFTPLTLGSSFLCITGWVPTSWDCCADQINGARQACAWQNAGSLLVVAAPVTATITRHPVFLGLSLGEASVDLQWVREKSEGPGAFGQHTPSFWISSGMSSAVQAQGEGRRNHRRETKGSVGVSQAKAWVLQWL